jgi:hypothetical protein
MAQAPDRRHRELRQQIADQEELIRRMIARGTASQAAEDRLRRLQERLAQMTRM